MFTANEQYTASLLFPPTRRPAGGNRIPGTVISGAARSCNGINSQYCAFQFRLPRSPMRSRCKLVCSFQYNSRSNAINQLSASERIKRRRSPRYKQRVTVPLCLTQHFVYFFTFLICFLRRYRPLGAHPWCMCFTHYLMGIIGFTIYFNFRTAKRQTMQE